MAGKKEKGAQKTKKKGISIKMKLMKEITINASADKVWGLIAHDFDKVGKWASAISYSSADNGRHKLKDAPMRGRTCRAGNSEIKETFLDYGEKKKTLSYEAKIVGANLLLPLKKAINHWSVQKSDPSKCIVVAKPSFQLSLLGLLMYPIVKWNINRLINQSLEELKYYTEKGKPHPRKLKTILTDKND